MPIPAITLSWPDHPALAEMVTALEGDVSYRIVGPRFREASGGAVNALRSMPLAQRAAAITRRFSSGAIASHRIRSAVLLRSASPSRLMHCCGHPLYGNSPWIGDYENVNVLGFYSPRLLRNAHFVEHLHSTLSQPACRAIRVWSESARGSFEALFPGDEIRRKLQVVHPAIAFPPEARTIPEKAGMPRLLFVAKGFWVKGGSLFLEALKLLRREVDFRADFVCDLPPECLHYRTELEGFVDFHEPVFSRTELFAQFFRHADIFVMLGMADSYGLVLLEASAFGLPIVAMHLNSGLSDLLRLTGNAIQVEPDHQIFGESGVHCIEPAELIRRVRADHGTALVERIAATLKSLICDRDLRAEMGERGRTAILEGSLSTAAMRRSMLDLYSKVMD